MKYTKCLPRKLTSARATLGHGRFSTLAQGRRLNLGGEGGAGAVVEIRVNVTE